MLNLICTKCGKDKVYVVQEEEREEFENQKLTMDDFAKHIHDPVPAIYKITTLRCKNCGYEISY